MLRVLNSHASWSEPWISTCSCISLRSRFTSWLNVEAIQGLYWLAYCANRRHHVIIRCLSLWSHSRNWKVFCHPLRVCRWISTQSWSLKWWYSYIWLLNWSRNASLWWESHLILLLNNVLLCLLVGLHELLKNILKVHVSLTLIL
jgi:hypothetical protein